MYEKVFAYLDAHAEDYAAQLCRWVEVPSVKGEATPDAPFGKDVRRMLDMAMADAKAFGYETRDFDGYACDITLPGESEEAIAVLGHLDVVPAGDNWATPPFTATRVGDQIFARGTSDDKGPALAALYAMNAIKAAGIPLISPAYANSNVDLPALPQELYGLVENHTRCAVMDIGGDDRGALALGRYAPYILEENNYEMIFVANFFRPLTRNAEEAFGVMREIEAAGGIPFTAIVNNSNIGWDTTPEVLRSTFGEADRLSRLSGLPILFTSAEHTVTAEMPDENLFPMTLQKKYFDIRKEKQDG